MKLREGSLTALVRIAPGRPERYLNKDIFCPAALLMEDTSSLAQPGPRPALSIEVRVKHGVVPKEAAGELLCNFCQKELLMCRDNNNPRSKYCPLDLFSGDRFRQTCQQCLNVSN